MEFTSAEAEQRYADLVGVAARTVIGLDFDGTLAPIVADPAVAYIHPDAPRVLEELAREVAAIAVVTGRPVRQALDLGGLEQIGDAVAAYHADHRADHGADHRADLLVFGQYGNERWSSADPQIRSPRPPAGLAGFERDLPDLLRRADAAQAWIEDKGLAVAVHTRRLPDPDAAYRRLVEPMTELARRHDLVAEPGRHVVEVRGPGMDKGLAVRTLVAELAPSGLLFAGDDLGDLAAFEAVADLRAGGLPALLVCSASAEQSALVAYSDVVVDGPAGVLDLLSRFTRAVRPR